MEQTFMTRGWSESRQWPKDRPIPRVPKNQKAKTMSDNAIEPTPSDFGTPFRALVDHCESRDLKFCADREEKKIKFSLCRSHALYQCNLRITHDDNIFQIYLYYPILAKDPKMRMAAAEFVTRANYSLVLGNFELDMRDGEVRYHVAHHIENGILGDTMIEHLFLAALYTSDRYFPAFTQVLFGGSTPEDAVFLAELDLPDAAAEDDPPTPPIEPPSEADDSQQK